MGEKDDLQDWQRITESLNVSDGTAWMPGASVPSNQDIDDVLDVVVDPGQQLPTVDTRTFWTESRLETLRNCFDIGRQYEPSPIDLLQRVMRHIEGSDDANMIRQAAGVLAAAAVGLGIGPRWCGLYGFGRRKRVKMPQDVRSLIFDEDYLFFDLLWLNRDVNQLDFQQIREEADQRLTAKERRGQFGKLPTAPEAFGCLRYRARALRAVESPAIRRVSRDQDWLLELYPRKTRSKSELAAQGARRLYVLRLLGIDVVGMDWDEVRKQVLMLGDSREAAWSRVAEVESWLTGERIKSESLESGIRNLVRMLVQHPPTGGRKGRSSSNIIVQYDRSILDDHSFQGTSFDGSSVNSIPGWSRPLSSDSSPVVVGVDPGRKGGLAMLWDGHLQTLSMPGEDDAEQLREIAELAVQVGASVFVEQVNPFTQKPKRGDDQTQKEKKFDIQAAFTFGRSRERAELPFRMFGLPIELLTPPSWQPLVGITGKDNEDRRKERLAELLNERFDILEPDLSDLNDGEVDAALIAVAGAIKMAEAQAT